MFYIFFSSYNIGCGGRLSGPSGSFTSPLYPSPYHHNAECTWEIHVNRGSQIRLIFLDLGIKEICLRKITLVHAKYWLVLKCLLEII